VRASRPVTSRMATAQDAPDVARQGHPRVGIVLFLVLGGLGMAAPMSTDMYLPSFPAIAGDLHAGAADVQLTLTTFMIGFAGGQLVLGSLSDRGGRRRFLLGGTAVMAVSSVLCALAWDIPVLAVARVLQGVGGAAGLVVGRAVVADLASGARAARIYSLLGLVGGVAPMLAPSLGAALHHLAGWRSIFLFIAAVQVALFLAVLFAVPESLPPSRRIEGSARDLTRPVRQLLRNRTYVGHVVVIAFSFGCVFAYISSSSFVVQQYLGLGLATYAIVFAVNSIGLIGAGLVGAALVPRTGPAALALAGLLQLGLGTVLLVVACFVDRSQVLVLAGYFLVASSGGLILGNTTAIAVGEAPGAAGTALALSGALQFAVAAVVAPLVGLGGAASVVPVAIVVASCFLLAVAGRLVAQCGARTKKMARE
jgi:MFS transporter, DHA1 family, multidrug resistance protein